MANEDSDIGDVETAVKDVDVDEYAGGKVGNVWDTDDVIVAVGEDELVAVGEAVVVAVGVRFPVDEGIADVERDVGGDNGLLNDCLLLCIDFE